jgi:putative transposase
MTNHVHLLLSPSASDGLSLFMQALGRRYVTYINKTYCRTGTLWEGRFKSSVIDSDAYCITSYRYIDLNPVRAGIVLQPAAYRGKRKTGSAGNTVTGDE